MGKLIDWIIVNSPIVQMLRASEKRRLKPKQKTKSQQRT